METFISPPPRMPVLLSWMLKAVERKLGQPLIANRILTWSPKSFLGSGIMEALVVHGDREVPARLLKLIRMQVSFSVSCPFCIDMNSQHYSESGISEDEILALRGIKSIDEAATLSEKERAALNYVRSISATPVSFDAGMISTLKRHFSERAIVIMASTAAQVNFWARLIQSFGVMPAGFTTECSVLELSKYSTRK